MPPVQGLDSPAYLVPGIEEWLLILPILTRLYTSVIPWNPEIWSSKVSWWTDLSPTTIFTSGTPPCTRVAVDDAGVEGCTRGGAGWVGREGYTGYYQIPLRDPYSVIFKVLSPTHGQMKAIYSCFMRFPEIGSRIDLELTQNRPQIALRIDLPDWSPDSPQIPISRT